ncbi:retrovirus-related pol polyprotein from transposon TNT 1-94 [Tanacetum coccineum]
MNASNTKVNSERSKLVTSQSTSNKNVIIRGMYQINKQDMKTPGSRANINVSNFTRVESSHSVRRSTYKDIKSKNSILKHTKSSSTYVWKTLKNDCLDSNKSDTKTSNCVACHALSRKSSVKRALFSPPLAAQSKHLGATSVVTKSRLSVATTPTAISKVSSVLTPSSDSRNTRTLSSYMNYKIATSRKWQKWFEYQHGFNWTPKSKSVQTPSSVTKRKTSVRSKTRTPVTTLKWVVKLSTLPSAFVSCAAEVARTMLIFSKAPEFLWAEAIATAYFTQNCSIVHTRQSKTPYELIRGRKPNVQYFHVFGYLCCPTNDRDDLGKMKPKADIGIFIGYSESSRGFQYLQSIPSKSDLYNLFDPLFEEYYSTSLHEVLDDSATNTTDNDYTSSSSSIIVDQDDAPPVVSSSDEQVANTPNSPVMNEVANEFVQNDVADFDGHVFHDAPQTPEFEVTESSSTY